MGVNLDNEEQWNRYTNIDGSTFMVYEQPHLFSQGTFNMFLLTSFVNTVCKSCGYKVLRKIVLSDGIVETRVDQASHKS